MPLIPLLVTVPIGVAAGGLFALTVAEAYGWLPRSTDPDSTPNLKDPDT